jgi:hypothetical protein
MMQFVGVARIRNQQLAKGNDWTSPFVDGLKRVAGLARADHQPRLEIAI